jgi:transposase
MELVDRQPRPAGTQVHLNLDNYGTHKTHRGQRWFAKRPYHDLHFTPTGASWPNRVERFFAEIAIQRVWRGAFRSTTRLERAIADYLADGNADPRPFTWTATADQILERVKRLCEQTCNSGH